MSTDVSPVSGTAVQPGTAVQNSTTFTRRQAVNSSVVTGAFLDRARTALERQRAICAAPQEHSDRVFKDILDQAEGTYFGKKHGLSAVRTLADWKKAVPVRCYPAFEPYIQKLLDGDSNVLTRSDPYAFLKTSGSSGKPKLIPTTRHWRNLYRGRALYAQWGLYFESIGYERSRGAAVLDLSWERTASIDPVGDFPSYSISQRPASVSSVDWTPPWYEEDWFQGVEDEDYKTGLYRKLRLLASSDVRIVVALNPSKIVGLAEQLAERSGDLIADLRHGTLDGLPCGDPDPARAAGLEAARRANGGGLRIADLWPDLSLVVSWNSASAALYRPWLEEVTPGVPKLPFSATGTEGIVTIPVDAHDSAGPLAIDLGLYEFVPADDRDDDADLEPDVETVGYRDLDVGRTYNVVMSQANGLYRYDLGDRYTVVDRVGEVPRMAFAGRSGFGSSFTGEKLTEEDVHNAVRLGLGDDWRFRPLFTCIPVWNTPPGYTLAIEWPEELASTPERFAERVEAQLQRLNIEYAEKRRTERLTPMRVLAVRPGTFAAIDQRRQREGASPAQLKHYWIQRNGDLLRYFDDGAHWGAS
ncbi:GH3 auxin-responsive promoter family protein [Streptomyces sp. UNOC14_S4]|uniref:GH3 auxin-responsive promoter family protein n=1 Tax=Streptomyces sp. UNOC14_S4 TaxID=2872340 RepID=UPI001E605ED0|nr:GH3 auxin-responsive promoter family protein [Streptomyces sp. UNOC14_S4]MCC3768878.1 GH3 auxin-responsive promoter family protein [Streptomyces sp. UNOC14_S4]